MKEFLKGRIVRLQFSLCPMKLFLSHLRTSYSDIFSQSARTQNSQIFHREVNSSRLKTHWTIIWRINVACRKLGIIYKEGPFWRCCSGRLYLFKFSIREWYFCYSIVRGVQLTISNKIITRTSHLNVGFFARN